MLQSHIPTPGNSTNQYRQNGSQTIFMGYSGIGAHVSSGMDVYVLNLLVPGNLIIMGRLELVIFLQLTLKLSMNPLI